MPSGVTVAAPSETQSLKPVSKLNISTWAPGGEPMLGMHGSLSFIDAIATKEVRVYVSNPFGTGLPQDPAPSPSARASTTSASLTFPAFLRIAAKFLNVMTRLWCFGPCCCSLIVSSCRNTASAFG